MLVWWLLAAASSARQFDIVSAIFASWFGQLVLFGYTWALLHHMLGGIRHFIWDTLYCLEPGEREFLAYATIVGSTALTIAVWVARLHAQGLRGYAMKTPFARARGLGAAHSGTEIFWMQRLTGVASVPLTIAFIAVVVSLVGASQASVVATLSNPFVAMILVAGLLAGLIHMQIGMQVIIEDYVHTEFKKIVLLMANTFFTLAVGIAAAYAILKINFGL